MIASSSAITTRVARAVGSDTGSDLGSAGRELGRDAVEEPVLLLFELPDRRADGVAVPAEGIGVATGVARLDVGERGLGHEGAQPDVLGLLLEHRELLV